MALTKMIDGVEVQCTPEEEAEILARWEANDKAQADDLAANGYKYNRKEAYPLIADQLDMLWHSMDNGEIPVAMEFYSAIAVVKKKYPKPQ